jgi:hypothetical protein
MGKFEFGIYSCVWTRVQIIGALSNVSQSSAARRIIPEYT